MNLICLDAPLVAVVWQWAFSRSLGVDLQMPARVALFLTAWLIYLLDRLGDTFGVRGPPPTIRHEFCRRHRTPLVALTLFLAASDGWIALRSLDARVLALGLCLAGVALIYLLVNHWCPSSWRKMPVKETTIALLFALGTALAPFAAARSLHFGTIASVGSFAALCFLNCVSIAGWEHKLDALHGNVSLITQWPRLARHLAIAAAALAVGGLIAAQMASGQSHVFYSIAASAAFISGMDVLQKSIPRDDRTALADLVLLTPLCLLCYRLCQK